VLSALSQISKLEGAKGYIIKRGRFMKGGVFFWITIERDLGTRNQ